MTRSGGRGQGQPARELGHDSARAGGSYGQPRRSRPIVVVSTNQGSLMCGRPLVHLRSDMLAVHLAKDAPDPLALQVAYFLARQTAPAKAELRDAADLQVIRQRAEEIMRRLTPLAEIRQHIATSLGSQEKASVAFSFERELRASDRRRIDADVAELLLDLAERDPLLHLLRFVEYAAAFGRSRACAAPQGGS